MLNYKKIRKEILKRYEKGEKLGFCVEASGLYIVLYDGCAVRLPFDQNPFKENEWEELPGLANLHADMTQKLRCQPVNRLVTGPDDMYHMIRADDRSMNSWYKQTVFSLLDSKEDYDFYVDPESKVLWITSEPAHQIEIVCAAVYVQGDEKE